MVDSAFDLLRSNETPPQEQMVPEQPIAQEVIDTPEQEIEQVQEVPQNIEPEQKVEESTTPDFDDSWLKGEEQQVPASSNSMENISKALGIEFKDEQHFVAEYSRVKSEYEDLKKKVETLESTKPFYDENLEKANEIAKNGGDYLGYLGVAQLNYDLIPDQDLIVARLSQFNLPQEQIENYLTEKSETDLKIEAHQIRENFKNQQKAELFAREQEVIEKKRKIDESIRQQLDQTQSVFGLKVDASDKNQIFSDLTSANFHNSVYFNKDGSYNYKNMSEAAYLLKRDSKGELVNLKKLINIAVQKATSSGKKEIFMEASNVQLKQNDRVPENTAKPLSGLDRHMSTLKG